MEAAQGSMSCTDKISETIAVFTSFAQTEVLVNCIRWCLATMLFCQPWQIARHTAYFTCLGHQHPVANSDVYTVSKSITYRDIQVKVSRC